MKNIKIGEAVLPALGFGTYKLYGKDAASSVDFALNSGYTHIDTAQIYENESEVGDGIKKSGVARDKIFLTTKVWRNHFADGTVAALQTDENWRARASSCVKNSIYDGEKHDFTHPTEHSCECVFSNAHFPTCPDSGAPEKSNACGIRFLSR